MQRAGVAAPEWPAELNHDDLADVVLGDLLRSYRWVLNFDQTLGVSLTPVPLDAVVLTGGQQEQWRKQQMGRVLAAIESGLKEVAL
ncbi:MAG: hypothetical protein GAK31_01956 [Stenotrophomonas maltophilia]|uniref:Uncharacterized protein n=1 Tax=Stenotrophomonas maltophilia TaxID=40324 RepID=A0A7V8FF87_STEMA|nr:MAG: hypothetical protein GAK31_01956 [Stenotrophomonas maltophilia]